MECRPNGPKRNFFGLGFSRDGGQTERESCRRLLFLSVFFVFFENKTKWRLYSIQRSVDIWKEQPKSHFGRGQLGGLSRTDEMITFHSRTLLVVAVSLCNSQKCVTFVVVGATVPLFRM